MTSKILLKRFDNNVNENQKIDLTQELLKIQREQENIFQEKLNEAEKKIHSTISSQLEEKFKIDLKNVTDELRKKYITDIETITQKFTTNYDIYQQNIMSIIDVFIKHHLKKMNKLILQQEIIKKIKDLFLENQQTKIILVANDTTIEEIRSILQMNNLMIDFKQDNAMIDYDIQIEYQEGGINFSLDEIMDNMNNIFLRAIDDIYSNAN